jgi:putative oxidoreductase
MSGQYNFSISIGHGVRSLIRLLSRITVVVAQPVLRIALALPFFRSGLTKWDGFLTIAPSAGFLFEEEFKLHIFGQVYGFPAPELLGPVTAAAEVTLPVLLVIGLATRFSAVGLLIMTGVIQLVLPDGWANFHLPWAAMALSVIALGPGPLSLDHLIENRFNARARALD